MVQMVKGNTQIDDVLERIQYFGCQQLLFAVNGKMFEELGKSQIEESCELEEEDEDDHEESKI